MGEACPLFNHKDPITMKETPKLKHCPSCGRDLPPEDFGPRKDAKDGLQANCKECRKKAQARTRERRMKEKEEKMLDAIFGKKEPSQPVPSVPPVPETERNTGKAKIIGPNGRVGETPSTDPELLRIREQIFDAAKAQMPPQSEIAKTIGYASSRLLIAELTKRGWKGTLTLTQTAQLNCE